MSKPTPNQIANRIDDLEDNLVATDYEEMTASDLYLACLQAHYEGRRADHDAAWKEYQRRLARRRDGEDT